MTPAAELRAIEKAFFGRNAVDAVDLDIRPGEIHGLLGENGAGKTTLCSVLAGLYRPEAGEIRVDGRPVVFQSPRDALDAGIGMVYQHFRLVRTLTAAENFILAHPDSAAILKRRAVEAEVRELGRRYGLQVSPTTRVRELSIGEQQRVEILKLLYRDVRVLVLDEPTAVLTPQEAASLFETVRALAAEGRAIVLVSHKLEDVLRVCDRITILRHGRRVAQLAAAEANPDHLARLMIGRDLVFPVRTGSVVHDEPVLDVSDLWVRGSRGNLAVRGVDLTLRRGEIVGVAGVAGNGQRELADALAGLRPVESGRVRLGAGSIDVTDASVPSRIEAGLAYVPEDRLGVGVAAGLPAWLNLGFRKYRRPPYRRGPFVSRRRLVGLARDLTDRFDVRGVSDHLPVRLLSGGNIQRLVLAREIDDRPELLVAASPTHGLDVAAIAAVHELLLSQREQGTAVLLMSEDLDELLALSDRIVVMYEGRIVGEVTSDEADAESIGMMMAGRHPTGRSTDDPADRDATDRSSPPRTETA